MSRNLESTYNTKLRFAYITPSVVGIPEFEAPERAKQKRFVIGTLANLTIDKGVGESIDTLESLLRKGKDVSLSLGGPVTSAEARARVQKTLAEHGDCVEHLGPIYGADKEAFFAKLDAFVFPTRYRNESWGIVLNEALMAGVPVITYRRGCIGYLVGDEGGLVVSEPGEFVGQATAQITQWIDNPSEHQAARTNALKRGRELRRQARSQLSVFCEAFHTDCWPRPDEGLQKS